MKLCFDSPPSSPRTPMSQGGAGGPPSSPMSQGGAGGPSPTKRPRYSLPAYLLSLEEVSTPVKERGSMADLIPTGEDLSVGDFGDVGVYNSPTGRKVVKTVYASPAESLNSANTQLGDRRATPSIQVRRALRSYEDAKKFNCPVVYPEWVEHDQPADPNSPQMKRAFDDGKNPYVVTPVRMCFPKGDPLMPALQAKTAEEREEIAEEAVCVYQTIAKKLSKYSSDPKPDNLVLIGGRVKAVDFEAVSSVDDIQWTQSYQFCGGDSELANYRRSLELIRRVICAGTEDNIQELRLQVESLSLEQLPILEGVEDGDGW